MFTLNIVIITIRKLKFSEWLLSDHLTMLSFLKHNRIFLHSTSTFRIISMHMNHNCGGKIKYFAKIWAMHYTQKDMKTLQNILSLSLCKEGKRDMHGFFTTYTTYLLTYTFTTENFWILKFISGGFYIIWQSTISTISLTCSRLHHFPLTRCFTYYLNYQTNSFRLLMIGD